MKMSRAEWLLYGDAGPAHQAGSSRIASPVVEASCPGIIREPLKDWRDPESVRQLAYSERWTALRLKRQAQLHKWMVGTFVPK